jgi:hypothetical protein
VVTPALKNEGVWKVRATRNGVPVIWTTGLRPLAKAPSVTATFALIDQEHTVAGMWNGPEVPGRMGFQRYGKVSEEFWPHLIAAWNGGFRKEHSNGGYFTEGREVWPLRNGVGTLAIDGAGKIHIGALGTEVSRIGMVSIRQNVHLLVQRGKSAIGQKDYEYGAWKDGNLFIFRSGICERADGKLVFAVMGPADARQFASAVIQAGCVTAMQLDVNAAWPKFSVFGPEGASKVNGFKIDARITGDADMFIKSAPKDFFAIFTDDMPAALRARLK